MLLLIASTMYQCLSLAAAADAGALPDAEGGERILVLANSSQVPEVTVPLQDAPGFDRVAARFDRVLDLATLIYPRRPPQFNPRHEELRMWQTVLRSHWALGTGPVTVVLDSVHVNPGIALARIFHEAPLWVHSDGLMVYGPTRSKLPLSIVQRLDGLLYVDLVPGLAPLLLREHSIRATVIPGSALRAVIDELAAEPVPELVAVERGTVQGEPAAVVLGQYLPELGLISRDDEAEMHGDMLRAAARNGVRHCIVKPHPSAGRTAVRRLIDHGESLGLRMNVVDASVPAEIVMARVRPDVVIGAFSTGMATAAYVLNTRVEAVHTGRLLDVLSPYENSNRIPVTIVDALMSGSAPGDCSEPANLQRLIETVAYCMQPSNLADGRDAAAAHLTEMEGTGAMRYFTRPRLTALDLPGGSPAGRPILAAIRRIPPEVRARVPRRVRGIGRRALVALAGS